MGGTEKKNAIGGSSIDVNVQSGVNGFFKQFVEDALQKKTYALGGHLHKRIPISKLNGVERNMGLETLSPPPFPVTNC